MQNLIPTLGKKVKMLRESKGWSQRKLAVKAKVDLRVLRRMEQSTGASTGSIDKVAEALDVSPEDLIDRDGHRPMPPDDNEDEGGFVAGAGVRAPHPFFGPR